MPNVWIEDDTEKLIALYGQYQCLWNPFHPEFNNKSLRYKAYKKIKNSINISGLTICDCIKRIANIKKEYCYELSKIAAAISCEKLYTPKAKWFKSMHMLFFPHMPISHYNNFRKQDNNYQKFNDIQDKFLHSSFEKSDSKQICSNNTCGTCDLQEIKLCLKLRDTVHSVPKLQDTVVPTIQMVDVATEMNNGIIVERETQTDLLHEQKYIADDNERKKQDRSTCTDDISIEVYGRKKIEDNFDIFGKSIAFQLRTIDIQTAVELEKEIQNMITKARLKILGAKLMDQSSNSFCCCDCNDCKVMCKNETCNCGLTLKECLLLTKIKESKNYKFCYKTKDGKKFWQY